MNSPANAASRYLIVTDGLFVIAQGTDHFTLHFSGD